MRPLLFFLLILQMYMSDAQKQVIVPLLHHDHVLQRRLTEQPTTTVRGTSVSSPRPDRTQVDPLYQGFGTHYVDLWVGCTNPQRQTVAVDTGSSLTAFPCNNCPPSEFVQNKCALSAGSRHVDPKYDTTQSDCFSFVRCNNSKVLFGTCETVEIPDQVKDMDQTYYLEHYSDQFYQISAAYDDGSSWTGHVAVDQVYSGGLHEAATEVETAFTPFYFGCQEDVEGLATLATSDGILGMDRGKASYWQQWVASQEDEDDPGSHKLHQVHPSSQFSLCFIMRPGEEKNVQGVGSGAMVMGGMEPRLNKHTMVYAQMLRDDKYYLVWIEKIYIRKGGGSSVAAEGNDWAVAAVDKRPADLNKGRVLLDSGSTGYWFLKELEQPFRKAWKKVVGKEYNPNEMTYTDQMLAALPTILIQLSARDKSTSVDPNQPGLAGRDNLDPDNPRSVVVALSPEHYMRYIAKDGMRASQIVFGVEDGKPQTLGSYLFAGHNIHFDIKNERIGFAESDCDMWMLGNPNFNHTPHEGDYPPSQPPTQIDTEEFFDDSSNQGLNDGWACGSMSCGSAFGIVLALGLVLGCFALCRRYRLRHPPKRQARTEEEEEFSESYRDGIYPGDFDDDEDYDDEDEIYEIEMK